MIINCLAVGGGGFVGALSRYGVSLLVGRGPAGISFPIATLIINVTGSTFLGWFYTFMSKRPNTEYTIALTLAIATGFVGAYTTFSTYMFETNALFSARANVQALTYLFGSLALGLVGVKLGVMLGSL
ncbi:MAG TPA: CrcB family protein [Tepidisphaeraceae bacterium]|nr:CrcB family protein [Tepidisphaeraceae bacterium]